jgi:hypothetical protein
MTHLTTLQDSTLRFLPAQPHNGPDLIDRIQPGLELQVNVTAGEPVTGKRSTFTDGIDEWFSYRIGDAERANYPAKFPLDLYAEAIGSTGWDWLHKVSRWGGFDFDSITGHAAGVGITDAALESVKQAACNIPWVEVRRSTGGKGLHLYALFDSIPTGDHNEHAALCRAVLGLMSTEAGFDFASQIDACGGNMWIWARKMTATNGGLALVKPAERQLTAADVPGWRDHIDVVTRKRTKVQIQGIDNQDTFEALASSRSIIPLDDAHKKIIDQLRASGGSVVWVPDYHLLQTHTAILQRVTGVRGFFKTNSPGNDLGQPNCFLFPLENGGWKVYRFSQGINEAETWEQDGEGWTTCYFNRAPDLKVAARAMGGIEDPTKGGFVFETAAKAVEVAKALGQPIDLPERVANRQTQLKAHRDGRLVVYVQKADDDRAEDMPGWLANRGLWSRVFGVKVQTKADPTTSYDHAKVRCLVGPTGERAGWMSKGIDGGWNRGTKDDCRSVLLADGNPKPEAEATLGRIVQAPWKIVHVPFTPPYPGNRQLNLGAVQFAVTPADVDELHHPTWEMYLTHLGQSLDKAIADHPWCKQHGVKTGRHWLVLWIACLIRFPYSKLPVLWAWGPESTGKSLFWEALRLLFTDGAICEANLALGNDSGFNADIAKSIVAFIEEVDLSLAKFAKARLKQWVTSPTLLVRAMRTDAYTIPSTLHFYGSGNSPYTALFDHGDTRTTFLFVPPPANKLEKEEMLSRLKSEASHFLTTLLRVHIPASNDRLRIPFIATEEKASAADVVQPLGAWLRDYCTQAASHEIIKADLYGSYRQWADDQEIRVLSSVAFGKQLREITGGSVTFGKMKTGTGKRKDSYVGITLKEDGNE